MIKEIQQYCNKEQIFKSSFESNWSSGVADYLENCDQWDTPDKDKMLLIQYSLEDNSNTRNYYVTIMLLLMGKGTQLLWKTLCEPFVSRFACLKKKDQDFK